MALDEGSSNGLFMPVAPAYSAGGNGNGNGFGGDWAWIILLLLLGWGNGGFGGGNNGGYGGGNVLYPWMNQSNQISDGFRDQMINGTINGIQSNVVSGFGDIQNSLCAGFAGVNASITNAQMADLERSFAAQTANMQGFNSLQASTADLKYTVANENCQDRYAAAQNTRDIIDAQTRSTQAILDKLCALELDGLKQDNANLRQQLNMANLAASQTAQTAELRQSGAAQLNQLVTELRACPLPAQPVYGTTPIFTCGQNPGCGCNGNSFYN